MDARRDVDRRADPVEREVRANAVPRAQQHEGLVVALAPRHVVERRLPELGLTLEVVDAEHDAPYDRADVSQRRAYFGKCHRFPS